MVAVVLPALLMNAVAGQVGVWSVLTGILLGVVGSKIGGPRRMIRGPRALFHIRLGLGGIAGGSRRDYRCRNPFRVASHPADDSVCGDVCSIGSIGE